MHSALKDYLENLKEYAGSVRVPGLDQLSTPIPLAEIFVQPFVKPQAKNAGVRPPDPELAGETIRSGTARGSPSQDKYSSMPTEPPEPALQALARESRLVILGEPGQGKSTLLRQYSVQLASNPEGRLPLLVELGRKRDWRESAGSDFAWLYERLPELLKESLRQDGWRACREVLRAGRAVVLLDGLDELDKQAQHKVAELVGGLRENRVVVSSRPHAYRLNPLASFSVCALGELQPREVELLATSVCRALAPHFAADGKAARDLVLRVADSSGTTMARNPLILSFMCLSAIQRQAEGRLEDFPTRAAPLIGECIDALVKWHSIHKVYSGWPDSLLAPTVTRVLAPLALGTFRNGSGVIKEKSLDELGDDEPGKEHRQIFLTYLVMARFVERRDRDYIFPLETFREYFAGLAVAAATDPFAEVRPFLHLPDWQRVILFAAENLRYRHASALDLIAPRMTSAIVRWTPVLIRVGAAVLGKSLGQIDPINAGGEAAKTALDEIAPLTGAPLEQWLVSSRRSTEYFIWAIWKHHCRWRWQNYEQILRRDLRLAARCLGTVGEGCPARLAAKLGSAILRSGEREAMAAAVFHPVIRRLCLERTFEKDTKTRAQATEALVGVAAEAEILPRLLDLTRDEDDVVRGVAIGSLKAVGLHQDVRNRMVALAGESVIHGEPAQFDGKAADRAIAVAVAVPEMRAQLLELTHNESPEVRCIAARGLRGVAIDPDVSQRLLFLTRDMEPYVRRAAAYSLQDIATEPDVRRRLLEMAKGEKDEYLWLRGSAADMRAAKSPGLRHLLELTGWSDVNLRCGAVQALKRAAGDAEVTDLLLEITRDPAVALRKEAVQALKNISAEQRVTDRLFELINDEDPSIRDTAFEQLKNLVLDRRVLEPVLALTQHEDRSIRRGAAEVLKGAAPESEVRQRLMDLTQDQDSAVRGAAARSLEPVAGEPDVWGRLLAMKGDYDWGGMDPFEIQQSYGYHLSWSDGTVELAAVEAMAGAVAVPKVHRRLMSYLVDWRFSGLFLLTLWIQLAPVLAGVTLYWAPQKLHTRLFSWRLLVKLATWYHSPAKPSTGDKWLLIVVVLMTILYFISRRDQRKRPVRAEALAAARALRNWRGPVSPWLLWCVGRFAARHREGEQTLEILVQLREGQRRAKAMM